MMSYWTTALCHSIIYWIVTLDSAFTEILPNLTRRETITELFNGYDPTSFPNDNLGNNAVHNIPTSVAIQIFISSIDSFDEAAMDYSMTIFLRQLWHDPRLSYENNTRIREPLELDNRLIDKIWLPDLFFVNEKNARFHTVTVPNRLLHIYKNGTIFYSLRLSLKLSCHMDLKKYPLDTQYCQILMESYAHSTEYIEFTWVESDAVITDNVVVSQFKLKDSTHEECKKNYGLKNYTCLRCDLRMERDTGYYIIQIYIPSMLIVILSWVSFWLNVEAIPARISLGVLTILTLTTQSSTLQATLPRVSYAKALDVWMAFCLFFVFAALLEFAFVNVLSRKYKTVSTEKLDTKKGLTGANSKTYGQRQALLLDKVSRFGFPLLFGLINIVYWVYYLLA